MALAFMVGLSIGLTQLFAPLFAEQAQAVQGMNELGMERVADETLSWIDQNLSWLNLSGNDQPNSLFLLEQIQGFVKLEGIGSFFRSLAAERGEWIYSRVFHFIHDLFLPQGWRALSKHD